MAIINRVSRLFRADLHAVLDQVEEPEVLLRQAVREMEQALDAERQRLHTLRAQQESLVARTAEVEHDLGTLAGELDLCFESGREDLARVQVRRQLETKRLAEALAARREPLSRQVAALDTQVADNTRRLERMRQHLDTLAEQAPAPERWSAQTSAVREEDVELALLRERRARGLS